MINQYDPVALSVDLPAEGLRIGYVGYVIEIHDDAYEVEFSRADGTTIAVVVLTSEQVISAPSGPQ
jgi:hypothetical protein